MSEQHDDDAIDEMLPLEGVALDDAASLAAPRESTPEPELGGEDLVPATSGGHVDDGDSPPLPTPPLDLSQSPSTSQQQGDRGSEPRLRDSSALPFDSGAAEFTGSVRDRTQALRSSRSPAASVPATPRPDASERPSSSPKPPDGGDGGSTSRSMSMAPPSPSARQSANGVGSRPQSAAGGSGSRPQSATGGSASRPQSDVGGSASRPQSARSGVSNHTAGSNRSRPNSARSVRSSTSRQGAATADAELGPSPSPRASAFPAPPSARKSSNTFVALDSLLGGLDTSQAAAGGGHHSRPGSAASRRSADRALGDEARLVQGSNSILTNVEKAMAELDAVLNKSPPRSRRPSSAQVQRTNSINTFPSANARSKTRPSSAHPAATEIHDALAGERKEYVPPATRTGRGSRSASASRAERPPSACSQASGKHHERPTSTSRIRAMSSGVGVGEEPSAAVTSIGTKTAGYLMEMSKDVLQSVNTQHCLTPEAEFSPTKGFSKIDVEGEPAAKQTRRKEHAPMNTKLHQAKLRLTCVDHATGEPVANVAIQVNTIDNLEAGKPKNYAKALGSSAITDASGIALVRLISGRSYVVTAVCNGYHKYGSLGERLTVRPQDEETIEHVLPMQPIRVAVIVTLRELQPLAGKSLKGDVYGQVNPLAKAPSQSKDMRIPAPQKVSFYTPAGTRMSFMASALMADSSLSVSVRPSADRVGIYSTDSEGHCYLYGPRVDGIAPNSMRNTDRVDNGKWWPTSKFHLRANPESGPVKPLFDHQTVHVDYPAHIARHNRSPSPTRKGPGALSNNYPAVWPVEADVVPKEADVDYWPDGAAVAEQASSMGPVDPEGIHNFLPTGDYLMGLVDQSRMLIFYTFTGDKEQAQITKAQKSVVPFSMQNIEASQLANKYDAPAENKVKFPVQLYCRARPWLQVLVIDSVTLEEVGVKFSVKYKVEKLDRHRCIPYRIAKLKAAITEQYRRGNPDPTDCQECRDDPHALEYIIQNFKSGRLNDLWARAELAEVDGVRKGTNSTHEAYNLDHTNDMIWNGTAALPFTSNEFESLEKDMYLPLVDGQLTVHESKRVMVEPSKPGVHKLDWNPWGGSDIAFSLNSRDAGSLSNEEGWEPPRRTWLTPGDTYAVTVQMEEPFMEMTMRQTRSSNWELEPFVFFALRKVRFSVRLSEVFTQGPVCHMSVRLNIIDYPRPPRPPVVKSEWCETAEGYAHRVLDQLIDFVVQSKHEMREQRVATELHATTDADGVATFWLPPKAQVMLKLDVGDEFEEEGATRRMTLSSAHEQSVDMHLERICYTQATVLDVDTWKGVTGFGVKAYRVTDAVEAFDPAIFTEVRLRRNLQLERERMQSACAAISIVGKEPIFVGRTGEDGTLIQPITCRAGEYIKLVVTAPPSTHLLPEHFECGSGSVLVSAYNLHTIKFRVPRRPRVPLTITDSMTREKVMGVRFRVMCRYINEPLIPEGESDCMRDRRDWPQGYPPEDLVSEEDEGKEGEDLGITVDEDETPWEGDEVARTRGILKIDTGNNLSNDGTPAPHADRTIARLKSQKSIARVALPDDFGNDLDEDDGGVPTADRSLRSVRSQKSIKWDGTHRAPWHGSVAASVAGSVATGTEPLSPGAHEMMLSGSMDDNSVAQTGQMVWSKYPDAVVPPTPGTLGRAALDLMSKLEGKPAASNEAGHADGDSFPDDDSELPAPVTTITAGRGKSRRRQDMREKLTFTLEGRGTGSRSRAHAQYSSQTHQFDSPDAPASEASVPNSGRETWAARSSTAGSVINARFADEEAPEEVKDCFFGRIWYDTCTGWPGSDDLMIDAGMEVRVEVLPCWPFSTSPLAHTKSNVDGWRDTEEFVFRLPRHDSAFKFWMERDHVQHLFWDAQGDPVIPYPSPLCRLQPHALKSALLAPLYLLDPKKAGDGAEVDASASESAETVSSGVRGSGTRALSRSSSAIQFEDDLREFWRIRGDVWMHLRMSDVRYLPLERMRLMSFLAKWGAFKHVAGGACKTCAAISDEDKQDRLGVYTMRSAVKPAWKVGDPISPTRLTAAAAAATAESASEPLASPMHATFTSSLLRTGKVPFTASWAYERHSSLPQKAAAATPWNSKLGVNKYPPSHAAMSHNTEAQYCKGPFFTWWMPDGSGIHVALLPKLYADVIPLLDSTAASLEQLDAHIEQVKAFNDRKKRQGRFLVGNAAADGCLGGVFVVEDSIAMPYGGTLFVLEQIAELWDHWYALNPDEPPQVNIMLVAGADKFLMRPVGLLSVCDSNLEHIKSWYTEAKLNVPRSTRGFLIGSALREAFTVSDMNVPIYLMCGGLLDKLKESRHSISSVLQEAQLSCISRKQVMPPVHTVEMMPTPKLVDEPNQMKRRALARERGEGRPGLVNDDCDDYARSEAGSSYSLDAPSLTLTDPGAQTVAADIFVRLQDSLTESRVRLVDAFNEMDKDGTNALNTAQLYRMVKRLVPDAQPEALRYLQLMLDADGNNLITYKHIASALKVAKAGGIVVQLREHLEVQMVLVKMAFIMLMDNLTADEVFNKYDSDGDGFWDQVEQWRMLKSVFPALTNEEQHDLFGALHDMDIDQDERISRDEFKSALLMNVESTIHLWEAVRDKEELVEARRAQGSGPDNVQLTVARSCTEHSTLKRIRLAEYPLSQLLTKVSGATRGEHRRLDMGHALADAELVDMAPLERARARLDRSLQQMLQFEHEYGLAISDHAGKDPSWTSPPAGAKTPGFLTAEPPLPPQSVRSVASASTVCSSAKSSRKYEDRGRDSERKPSSRQRSRSASASRSRPQSAPYSRTSSVTNSPAGSIIAPLPNNSRLLNTTASRDNYMTDTAYGGTPAKPRPKSAAVKSSNRHPSPSKDINAPRKEYVPSSSRSSARPTRAASAAPVPRAGADQSPSVAKPRPRPQSAWIKPVTTPPVSTLQLRTPLPMASAELQFDALKAYSGIAGELAVPESSTSTSTPLKKAGVGGGFKGTLTMTGRSTLRAWE